MVTSLTALTVLAVLAASAHQKLVVVERVPELSYELWWGHSLIETTHGDVRPGAQPVVEFRGSIGRTLIVLVGWQGPSQGCLDYGYTLLRLHDDGSFARTDLHRCARLEPEVTVSGAHVIVKSAAYRTFDGALVPAMTWEL